MLDAAFMIRVRRVDARVEEVFPCLTAEKVAQVWKRVNRFEDVTFRWGAEYMDLVYQWGLDDESRERALQQLRERHDRSTTRAGLTSRRAAPQRERVEGRSRAGSPSADGRPFGVEAP